MTGKNIFAALLAAFMALPLILSAANADMGAIVPVKDVTLSEPG
jgi:hypothetical protein